MSGLIILSDLVTPCLRSSSLAKMSYILVQAGHSFERRAVLPAREGCSRTFCSHLELILEEIKTRGGAPFTPTESDSYMLDVRV